jgi:hypothetical protein
VVLSKNGSGISKVGAELMALGTGIVRYFRAGYPGTFPRNGFIVAAALLPQQDSSPQVR